jgi:putative hydrolase of the HAD superfamily
MTSAVIFDLWRTLVPLTSSHRSAALRSTASALGCADRDQFDRTWRATRAWRETRALPVYLRDLRRATGAGWSSSQLDAAMTARREAHFAAFSEVRPAVRETLTGLRALGFRLGLVSNCTSDVREMLRDSGLEDHFDAVVLSAEVGLMKPDPEIFRLAMGRLDVSRGFYVGDGDDGELAGARSAGLVDILLDLGEGRSGTHRVHRIEDISEIVRGDPL